MRTQVIFITSHGSHLWLLHITNILVVMMIQVIPEKLMKAVMTLMTLMISDTHSFEYTVHLTWALYWSPPSPRVTKCLGVHCAMVNGTLWSLYDHFMITLWSLYDYFMIITTTQGHKMPGGENIMITLWSLYDHFMIISWLLNDHHHHSGSQNAWRRKLCGEWLCDFHQSDQKACWHL